MNQHFTNIFIFFLLFTEILSSDPEEKCFDFYRCEAPYEFCDFDKGYCVHKNIWPVHSFEIIWMITLGIIMALCNAAGIGGGGIVIPICIILFKFNTTYAIALSNTNIFVASLTRFIFNFKEKHPLRDAVVINYEIVLIMLPGTILGSLIGVQLNSILPDIATMIMLTILLFFMGYKSLFSGLKKYREETFEMKERE